MTIVSGIILNLTVADNLIIVGLVLIGLIDIAALGTLLGRYTIANWNLRIQYRPRLV